MSLKEDFESHGWIHIKQFFNADQLKQLRGGVKKSLEDKINSDLLCNPYLVSQSILNKRLVNVISSILDDMPIYFGDSSISSNDAKMSLHKDNPDRTSASAPDWRTPYTIVRAGIYLQDYTLNSGGLILRDGSHNIASRWKGKILNPAIKPGDLVIWSLRTTHSGGARRLKIAPNMAINPYIIKHLPDVFFTPRHNERTALFVSFGKNDHHLSRYIKYLKTRSYAVQRWRKMDITQETIEAAKDVGLSILDLSKEARGLADQSHHLEHRPIS